MTIEQQVLINKFGQKLIKEDELLEQFKVLEDEYKRLFLIELIGMIVQSKPLTNDIELAIENSNLKPTLTPCVLLRKGILTHHLERISKLPKSELNKSFILLIYLFQIGYTRRYELEKNNSTKWWYWDLSKKTNLEKILNELNSLVISNNHLSH